MIRYNGFPPDFDDNSSLYTLSICGVDWSAETTRYQVVWLTKVTNCSSISGDSERSEAGLFTLLLSITV